MLAIYLVHRVRTVMVHGMIQTGSGLLQEMQVVAITKTEQIAHKVGTLIEIFGERIPITVEIAGHLL